MQENDNYIITCK